MEICAEAVSKPLNRFEGSTDEVALARMYHICHINSSAGVGGGERHLLLLARYLHGSEFHFNFILPEEGPVCDQLRRLGLNYQVVAMNTKLRVGAWRAIHYALRQSHPDVVHCHGARANWYGRIAAKRYRAAAIFCTVHNSLKDYPYPAWRRRLYVALERRTAGMVDQFIAVSDALRNDLVTYYRLPAEKIQVVPNGIDVDELRVGKTREEVRGELGLEPDAMLIVEVARMTEQKGHRFLLQAVANLHHCVPKLRCLLVGDGPTRAALHRQVVQLHIAPCVRFLGFRPDVPDLINAADIYVLPSLSEGMPIGLLEAMALGCPVVASAVNGIPEVVQHGVNGLLLPAGDVAGLTELIGRLASDFKLREQLACAARQTVRRSFSAQQMADRIAQLYRLHLECVYSVAGRATVIEG